MGVMLYCKLFNGLERFRKGSCWSVHYHLSDRTAHLKEALAKIRPEAKADT
jgi:hypothetical protein